MNKNTELSIHADDGQPVKRPFDADANARRQAVVELVAEGNVASQAELAALLTARGFVATQATLSRDLKALGIGKVPAANGYVYVLPRRVDREVVAEGRTTLEIEAFVREVRVVNNLVLLRTPPGNAQGVGLAIDALKWSEVAGTISGDDTILIVTMSATEAETLRERLERVAGRKF